MPFRKTALFLVFLLMTPLLGIAENTLSMEDVAKIRIVHKKYEEAWLKGDADAVRALFTDDTVLLPPHAGKPCIGLKGLNDFWFPPNAPPTKITKLVVTLQSIGGDGQLPSTWGTHEVACTTAKSDQTTTPPQTRPSPTVLKQ